MVCRVLRHVLCTAHEKSLWEYTIQVVNKCDAIVRLSSLTKYSCVCAIGFQLPFETRMSIQQCVV